MTLAFAFLIFVFAAGLCILLVGMVRAPEGHEDEKGFHAMRPIRQPGMAVVVIPTDLPQFSRGV